MSKPFLNGKRNRKIGVFFLLALLSAGPVGAAEILEYLTPSPDSSPSDLAFDAQGNLWFTEINGNKIGKLVPSETEPGTSKGIQEYELPNPNSKPNYLIVSKDGQVWFSEMAGRIGRLDPATGKISEYPVPTPKSEPHHLAEGDDGSIWFLEFETNKIARLNPKSGSIKEYAVNEGHPHDLVLKDNSIWYSQGGKFWAQNFFNKIGRFDIASGTVSETTVPPKKSVPHGMALGGDGTIWFTQLFANKISRLDMSSGEPKVVEYPLEGRKGPHDLVVDDQRGRVWFVLNRADSIGLLDISKARPGTSEGMSEFKIPTPKAHPSELVVDPEGNVWFTEMGHYFMGRYQNKIGKLVP
ncbi:MAG: Lyase-like protein [Nitrospinota bacterium]|nr:Lyase-like protein [Nitrospinota bacterium]